MMKTTVICALDKEYPPEHSFIDGMLASELPKQGELEVLLLVSRGKARARVQRYGKSVCIPALWPRCGIYRFANLLILMPLLLSLIRRKRASGNRVVLFIRNEPIYLVAAWLLRRKVDRIVFQQSFPHEKGSAFSIKSFVAISIFRFTSGGVDALVAVSPLGLKRIRGYFGSVPHGLVIPLLGCRDERMPGGVVVPSANHSGNSLRYVYIGTHSGSRQLDVVLRAIVRANKAGANAIFDFIGGKSPDVESLRGVPGVTRLEEKGIVNFRGRISRRRLLAELPKYQVGLSLIPPLKVFREASPTKLAEYMNSGLAVLASTGIPLQEHFIRESGGGILVEWSESAISKAILKLSSASGKEIMQLREQALSYAVRELDYSNYVGEFREILC